MQAIRAFDVQSGAMVGFGIRVMLISGQAGDALQRKLAGLGSKVEWTSELFVGLEAVIDDPAGYGLCIIDCASIGGLEAGRRAHALLVDVARRVPVILLAEDCPQQEFPEERGSAVVLRAPVSSISLRVGFEHALRDRFSVRMI